jgi:hypothetical protein
VVEVRGTIPERVRRALYGLSRGHCYAPGCDEPVIVLDGGEPVFVGEIAHIVAAVVSGPRGCMDVPDREAFENLLILCGRHHKIIDDVRTRDRYPVEEDDLVTEVWKLSREYLCLLILHSIGYTGGYQRSIPPYVDWGRSAEAPPWAPVTE